MALRNKNCSKISNQHNEGESDRRCFEEEMVRVCYPSHGQYGNAPNCVGADGVGT